MNQQQPRVISNEELATLVKIMRISNSWSQEQLSELTHLNVRTIQRVENGKGANFDTRRALAIAFESNDIDSFNKSYIFPTLEEAEASKKLNEEKYITLNASNLNYGKEACDLAEWSNGNIFTCDFELPRNVQEAYAKLTDLFNDFRDIHQHYCELEKLDISDVFNRFIKEINLNGFCIKYAKRQAKFNLGENSDEFTTLNLTYICIFPECQAPCQFTVPRKVDFTI